MSQLAALWNDSLTPGQREGWRTYASSVLLSNRVGEELPVGGFAMFKRSNLVRLQINASLVLDAPTEFNLGPWSGVIFTVAFIPTQQIIMAIGNDPLTDPWSFQLASFLVVYIGRPQNSSIRSYRGSFQFAGAQEGNPIGVGPGFGVESPFPFSLGQRIFGRGVVTYLDGRLTSEFQFSGDTPV